MRLRSLLFVPGDRPERMDKALRSGADAVILDLEDSVALSHKAQARDTVAEFLLRTAAVVPRFVRINPLSSGFAEADLEAVMTARPDGLVLPKSVGAESVRELDRRLAASGADLPPILPLATETPQALFGLADYGAVARRLVGLAWGVEDLSAAVGAASARESDEQYTEPYRWVRSLTLFAAAAANVAPIDTVFPAFQNLSGLAQYARCGMRDGFAGMLAIHPTQVAVINEAFTPSAQSLERARAVVALFAANPGAGVLAFKGVMVDAPHLKQALRLLSRSQD